MDRDSNTTHDTTSHYHRPRSSTTSSLCRDRSASYDSRNADPRQENPQEPRAKRRKTNTDLDAPLGKCSSNGPLDYDDANIDRPSMDSFAGKFEEFSAADAAAEAFGGLPLGCEPLGDNVPEDFAEDDIDTPELDALVDKLIELRKNKKNSRLRVKEYYSLMPNIRKVSHEANTRVRHDKKQARGQIQRDSDFNKSIRTPVRRRSEPCCSRRGESKNDT